MPPRVLGSLFIIYEKMKKKTQDYGDKFIVYTKITHPSVPNGKLFSIWHVTEIEKVSVSCDYGIISEKS